MRWRIAALQGATRKPSMTCSARGRRVLVQVAYAGGLRISELVALTWGQVIRRDDGKVQLNVLGKGNKPSQVTGATGWPCKKCYIPRPSA